VTPAVARLVEALRCKPRRSRVRFLMVSVEFVTDIILPTALLIQPLTEMSKGKAIPLRPLTGPEGSRRLRLPDFKTIGT
jgi:hypothetical protein